MCISEMEIWGIKSLVKLLLVIQLRSKELDYQPKHNFKDQDINCVLLLSKYNKTLNQFLSA